MNLLKEDLKKAALQFLALREFLAKVDLHPYRSELSTTAQGISLSGEDADSPAANFSERMLAVPPHPTLPPPCFVSLWPPAGSQGWAWPEEGAEVGSLTGWNSALLEARAVLLAFCPAPSPPHPQLYHLRVTAAKAAAAFQIPNHFFLVHQCQAQQSTSPPSFLHHPCQEMCTRNLLDRSIPAGFVLPAGTRVVQVPHEDQSCEQEASLTGSFCAGFPGRARAPPASSCLCVGMCTCSRCGVCVDFIPSCPCEQFWDHPWGVCVQSL